MAYGTTKIMGVTIVSNSSDQAAKEQVDALTKRLKQHEGHLLPQFDQSSEYQVTAGQQNQYYKRLTSSNPQAMQVEFIVDLDKSLGIKERDSGSISKRCYDGNKDDFCKPDTIELVSDLLSRGFENAMICWHLEQTIPKYYTIWGKEFKFGTSTFLVTECFGIQLVP